jgi:large subunit ribosomal protein L10
MPNALNIMMKKEMAALLGEFSSCVVVDFLGLSVEEFNGLRDSLRKNDILMKVVKTALVRLELKELGRDGCDELFSGPIAVVWGGKDIVQVSKAVSDFAKKNKALKIKGGLLENETITKQDVAKLTSIPEMPVLLAGIAAGIAAPLQGLYNSLDAILSSIARVIDAVREKAEKGEAA